MRVVETVGAGELGGPPAAPLISWRAAPRSRRPSASTGRRRAGWWPARRPRRPPARRGRAGRRLRGGRRGRRRRRRRRRWCRPASTANGGTCHSWSWVTTRTPAPPRVVTTAPTPAAISASAEPSSSTSCSLGTRTSTSGSSRAGSDGRRRRVEHGADAAGASQLRGPPPSAPIGTSSCVSTTSAGRQRGHAHLGVGAGHDDDRVLAVVIDGDHGPARRSIARGRSTASMPAAASWSRRNRPASSRPRAPTKVVAAPARAAATAWLRPLPPACSAKSVPRTVSPGAGRRGVEATRSRLALPTTQTSGASGAHGAAPSCAGRRVRRRGRGRRSGRSGGSRRRGARPRSRHPRSRTRGAAWRTLGTSR